MATRRVFYSFHYIPDCQRVSQVRNMGAIEDNAPASDNDWETVTKGGDAAIRRWIDRQLQNRTCTVVLVGAGTAGRKWISHEITESWNKGMGVVGVRIHNLKDLSGKQTSRGGSPFDSVTFKNGHLSDVVKLHEPAGSDSKEVYGQIKRNLATWIEDAITLRARY